MSAFSVLVAEDDVIISEYLASIITEMGHTVCCIVSNYNEAKEYLERHEAPHLALLDIRMHNRDQGIDIAADLRIRNIPFVFITSFTDKETLQKAVEQQPLGYIVKPFKKEEVKSIIEKALSLMKPDHLLIKDGTTHTKVFFNDILYLKSDNVYIEICAAKKTFLVRAQLTEFLKEFPPDQFVRVHRSYAVNVNKVTKYHITRVFIDEVEIPVSKAYAEQIKKYLR